jgi:amidase
VKDVVEVAGVISAAGLPERAEFRPALDAVVVTRMRAAGAILLGKTNCPPGGGGGFTDNPVYGRTNNPYDLRYSPGGSSGGEAAAIAACMSPLGIGSDSGGSIRERAPEVRFSVLASGSAKFDCVESAMLAP